MKRASDELMYRGPAWLATKRIEKHPSNGTEEALRYIKRTWPTRQTINASDFMFDDLNYTMLKVEFREEPYGSYSTSGTREYLHVGFKTSNNLNGSCVVSEHRNMWQVERLKHYASSDNKVLFQIIQDHREYPIWTTRRATLKFLFCAPKVLPFPKDIVKLIAKEIWASRFDRSVWWPDITDEEMNVE